MIGGHRVVAAITARAGSKGVPGKNLRALGGRPLITWSIEAALEASSVDRVIVTTDGGEIAAVARESGAEVQSRPADLAGDEVTSAAVLRDMRGRLRAEGEDARYMVLLQPTSPFRRAEDIERCLTALEERALESAATFTPARLNPHRAWRIDGERPEPFMHDADPWLPRQLLPPAYELNGAVYAFVLDALPDRHDAVVFGDAGAVLMDPVRSIDIDDELDLVIAEAMLERGLLT